MAGERTPGPMCQVENPLEVDDGTTCRAVSRPPGPMWSAPEISSSISNRPQQHGKASGGRNKKELFEVGGVGVFEISAFGQRALVFKSKMHVDADGAPNAYHPDDGPGLDALSCAGHKGHWWGIVTDQSGVPVIQGPGDPCPGFYISTTSLQDHSQDRRKPTRYVDAGSIPFIVLPPQALKWGVSLGDTAAVYFGGFSVSQPAYAIFADVGPRDSIGEGSIALADALGVKSNPRRGGVDQHSVIYVVFPGSKFKPAWPVSVDQISRRARESFLGWGGVAQLRTCFPEWKPYL